MLRAVFNFITNILGLDIRKKVFSRWISVPGGYPRTILDIGANEGQFALAALRSLPHVDIYSFEPLNAPYQKLSVLADKYPRLHPAKIALGDKKTKAQMYTGEHSPSSSLLTTTEEYKIIYPTLKYPVREDIAVDTLDSWAKGLEFAAPLFIKMDVQGYEAAVIRGGGRTIKQAAALLCEVSFMELYKGQPLFLDICQELQKLDFALTGVYDVSYERKTGRSIQCDALFINKRKER